MGGSVSLSRRRVLAVGAAVLGGLAGCSSRAAGGDWPTWRHDAQRTSQTGASGPAEGRVRWRSGFASRLAPPVVQGDRVVVGGDRMAVYGVSTEDGGIAWEHSLFNGSQAAATIRDETVFVPARTGLHAYELGGGEAVWEVLYPAPGTGWSYHTPAVAGETLYAGATAFRYNSDSDSERFEYLRDRDSLTGALDAGTGDEQWQVSTGPQGTSSFIPAVADGRVFVGRDQVYALDAESGEESWTFADPAVPAWGDPAVANDLVFVPGERDSGGSGGVLFALDAATGEERWRVTGRRQVAPPAVVDDTVSVAGEQLRALDIETGEVVWRRDDDWIVAVPPAVAGGTIYLATATGGLYALGLADGSVEWTLSLSAGLTGPAIADDGLYIADASARLYAIE